VIVVGIIPGLSPCGSPFPAVGSSRADGLPGVVTRHVAWLATLVAVAGCSRGSAFCQALPMALHHAVEVAALSYVVEAGLMQGAPPLWHRCRIDARTGASPDPFFRHCDGSRLNLPGLPRGALAYPLYPGGGRRVACGLRHPDWGQFHLRARSPRAVALRAAR
jgi:hypothetical protein